MRFASIQCNEMRLGSLQRSPDPLAGFKGREGEGGGREGGKGKGVEGKERSIESVREVKEKGRGRGGEDDSDAQLKRLSKAYPVCLNLHFVLYLVYD